MTQHPSFPSIILKDVALITYIPADSEPRKPVYLNLIHHIASFLRHTFCSHFSIPKSGSILQCIAFLNRCHQGAVKTQLSACAGTAQTSVTSIVLYTRLELHAWSLISILKCLQKLHKPYLQVTERPVSTTKTMFAFL